MAFLHGKTGRVTAAGSTLEITKWTADHEIPGVEVTNSESGGFQEMLAGGGIAKLSGTVEADFDAAASPYASPPDLMGGSLVALELYTAQGGSKYACSAHIDKVSMTLEVRSTNAVSYSFTFQSSGTITDPA
jgi:hypothetical protein